MPVNCDQSHIHPSPGATLLLRDPVCYHAPPLVACTYGAFKRAESG